MVITETFRPAAHVIDLPAEDLHPLSHEETCRRKSLFLWDTCDWSP